MKLQMKPLVEVNRQAFWVLYRELGVVDAARFLQQFTEGFGDYSKKREALFAGRSLEEIIEEIKQESGDMVGG